MSFPPVPPCPAPPLAPPSTTTTTTIPLLSCVSCRSRKIKCSKVQPACSACQRSNVGCVYPARTRLPRGKQAGFKARNVELSQRLNRLESLVGKLGAEHAGLLNDAGLDDLSAGVKPAEASPVRVESVTISASPKMRASGALLASDGTRYLSGDFWASLSQEVDGLKQLLNEPSAVEEETDIESPDSTTIRKSSASSDYAPTTFIFSGNVEPRDLRPFHPPSPQMSILSETYFHRCDPLFKILHRPTMTDVFARAANDLSNIQGFGMESLMFAMYYAAITSLQEDECLRYFREEKSTLLQRYKYATEIAFVNADFLNSMHLEPLQAYSLYLTCSRFHSSSRDVWALTALALRIAQALDLPRDGSGQNLRPFEAEMRRRLWWQICNLDTRGSADRGTYPMILENTFTTRRPLNINDEDIDCSSEREPAERSGFTDMTFCLITCETTDLIRRLNYVPPTASDEELEAYNRETERIVKEVTGQLESKYLSQKSDRDLYQLALIIVEVAKKKAWLCCQYPLLPSRVAPRSDANREEILSTAIWLLEFDSQMQRGMQALSPWQWYSKVFVQWHPLAVALVQLCLQTRGPTIEHAWSVVDRTFDHVGENVADNRKGTLWKPIQGLLKKARAARAHASAAQATRHDTREMGGASPRIHESFHTTTVQLAEATPAFTPSLSHFGAPRAVQAFPAAYAASAEPYVPELGHMSLEQQHHERDAVNWTDWMEFVTSTWDSDQLPHDAGGTWNPQLGFQTV